MKIYEKQGNVKILLMNTREFTVQIAMEKQYGF